MLDVSVSLCTGAGRPIDGRVAILSTRSLWPLRNGSRGTNAVLHRSFKDEMTLRAPARPTDGHALPFRYELFDQTSYGHYHDWGSPAISPADSVFGLARTGIYTCTFPMLFSLRRSSPSQAPLVPSV